MRILFAVQGTGNGHISRAREIIPHLLHYGDLDVLISGRQADVGLPYMIRYKRPGISYTFGKNGGIDFIDSIRHLKPFHFLKDILTFPVHHYDIVINDFEPVTSWACKIQGKACIALSHQAAYLSAHTPRPVQKSAISESILKNYAPSTHQVGFHFSSYDSFIRTPVIRSEIRNLEVSDGQHYTVYLPAHDDRILTETLTRIPDVKWEVFSKHAKTSYRKNNVFVAPVNNEAFLASLASCTGLLTAGGFESPAEAIFMGKKIFAVPMMNQYEQRCNAEAMKQLGVSVAANPGAIDHHELSNWIANSKPLNIQYPDETGMIIEHLLMEHANVRNGMWGPGEWDLHEGWA